jgi:hypothetical protein
MGNQRRRVYDLVAFALEKLKERVANLVSAHVHAALPEIWV